MIMYKEVFDESGLTYVDVAHALGCCELTARNKISGKTRVTKAEASVLDNLFCKNTTEGADATYIKNTIKGADTTCTISRHNR